MDDGAGLRDTAIVPVDAVGPGATVDSRHDRG
jgi:hypothetical protein